MARTFIGIDVDDNLLRVVALEEHGKELKTVAIVQRDLERAEQSAEAVASILRDWETANTRLALALPCRSILARRLKFPFGDRKKIAAAVPLELGARLPVDLTDHFVVSLPPVAADNQFSTIGLALPPELLGTTLAPFDEQQLPLRHVSVAPFAYIGKFREQPADCLLVAIRKDEISTVLVEANQPVGYRTFARHGSLSAADTVAQLHRDVMSLLHANRREDQPVLVFGSGLDDELQKLIFAALPTAALPDETFEDEKLPPQFLPALALARLAASPGRNSFNLRQGDFAYRGNLAPFKKQLVAAAILLTLTLTALVGGSWLAFARKANTAKQLQKQLQTVYQQTFPQSTDIPKDIALHMTSRLNESQRQQQLLGSAGPPPLRSLEAISQAFPAGEETLIKELSYDKDGIRLTGQTSSFDSVDQLAAGLNRSTLFSTARISDAKMNIDGKHVNFRIELGYVGQGGQP